jgi:hypothetical protein
LHREFDAAVAHDSDRSVVTVVDAEENPLIGGSKAGGRLKA